VPNKAADASIPDDCVPLETIEVDLQVDPPTYTDTLTLVESCIQTHEFYTFHELTAHNDRREAVRRFADILQLSKINKLRLEQSHGPYTDIRLTPIKG
jgi:chromatin segregation and condensation protein Rec8/ScpA/Scc1 (kleisin family)